VRERTCCCVSVHTDTFLTMLASLFENGYLPIQKDCISRLQLIGTKLGGSCLRVEHGGETNEMEGKLFRDAEI
jgi:hypothetical protein